MAALIKNIKCDNVPTMMNERFSSSDCVLAQVLRRNYTTECISAALDAGYIIYKEKDREEFFVITKVGKSLLR